MGDWASAVGIQKFIKKAAKEDIYIFEKYLFDKFETDIVNKINEEYDCIVIGGGGVFRKHDNKSGLLWNIDYNNIMNISKPIYFYSVGLNTNINHKKGRLNKSMENVIKSIFTKKDNVYLGARDYITYKWALNLGIRKLFFVPCPSMFVNYRERKNKDNIIGINIVPKAYMTFPKYIIRQIKRIVKILSRKYNFILISHNSGNPTNYEIEVAKYLGINPIAANNPSQILRIYSNLKAAIVMRGHPILFSIANKTPVVPICYNIKSNSFAELFDYPVLVNMPNCFYSIFNNILSGSIIEKLHWAIENRNELFSYNNSKMKEFKIRNERYAKMIMNNIYDYF